LQARFNVALEKTEFKKTNWVQEDPFSILCWRCAWTFSIRCDAQDYCVLASTLQKGV
jgi:hypothetical protein